MKIIVVIITDTIEQAIILANQAIQADIVELRIDGLNEINLQSLQFFKQQVTQSVIFTIRAQVDGGFYKGNEIERLALLFRIASLQPNYIDIEHHVNEKFIQQLKTTYPTVKVIRSFHAINTTPEDINKIFASMQHPLCDVYKVVTYANSALDALKILAFIKKYSSKHAIVAHAMGDKGAFTRLAGVVLGNVFCYTQLKNNQGLENNPRFQNQKIPGIIFLDELINIYHVKKLNAKTKIYALLGEPILNSIGHIFHNKYFMQYDINAIYVKIRLNITQLKDFLAAVKALPFMGFSITMPLKQAVLPFVQKDKIIAAIGATNTLKILDNKILLATNTDAVGALNSVEKIIKVKNKNILIIGAGGAASAVCYAAYTRGANIYILNRTLQNATKLAKKYAGEAFDFTSILLTKQIFDVIINAVSYEAKIRDDSINVLSNLVTKKSIYMDINYANPNIALQTMARAQNLKVIDGMQMFNAQAKLQQQYWNEKF